MAREGFGNLKGIGFTLVGATPLIFIGLGTIFAWRSGYAYFGFEGTFLVGGAAAVWIALLTRPGQAIGPMAPILFFPLVFAVSFVAGGLWSGVVGLLRARFGGNEVLMSLMMNYLAVFLVNYLVSGPLACPRRSPTDGAYSRCDGPAFHYPSVHAHTRGFSSPFWPLFVTWIVLQKTRLGYELIATGLNARAARYGGIDIGRRLVLASFLAGGLGAWAGLSEVLGVQFRLLDGISQGTGFIGIVAALLGKLHPAGVVVASILYAGMGVGADAMQRKAGLPSSVIFTVQALIVLLILASDLLRYYRIRLPGRKAPGDGEAPAEGVALRPASEE